MAIIWLEINFQTSFSLVLLQVQQIVAMQQPGKHS